ncbi:hypothetical protein [Kitasatospora sp. MBT63]|uniref:hypothetical protein n=1 Tax=Kitasatospora sp. MBT63 TaxID=1444768 RepID=UPI00053A2249|nr:hypothetical protein [Kitasatospora sp. MBT63]
MGSNTGGNGSQADPGGIQLPTVAWEIEEGPAAAAAGAEAEAPSYGPVEPAAAEAPPAPKYGRVLPGPNAVRRQPEPAEPQPGPVAVSVVEPESDPEADDRQAPRPRRIPPGVFPFLSPEPEPEPEPRPVPMPDPTAVGLDGEAPDGIDQEEPEHRRSKKPMMFAAVAVGALLLGLPFVLTGSGTKTPGAAADQPPAGVSGPGDPLPTPGPNDPTAVAAPVDATLLPGSSASPTDGTNGAGGAGGANGTTDQTTGAAGSQNRQGTTGGTATGGSTGGGSTSGGSTGGGSTSGGGAPVVPVPNKTTPAAPTFTAVAGTGCTNAGIGYDQNGFYTDGSKGWTTNTTGGYAGSGCGGKYVSVPMSGSAGKDAGKSVLWAFTTNPVPSGNCRISVYIPNNGDVKAVGGKPAYYTVQRYFTTGEGTISAFTIDQTANRGKWVNAGTFPVTNGKIAVMLHDRGVDFGSGAEQAHHAASAVRADCS